MLKVISSKTALSVFIFTTFTFLVANSSAAKAECVPAAYPPVVCLNTSSGISPATVDTTVAAAVAQFESAPPTPVGTTSQAVITIPVTVIDPVTNTQSTVNVVQTITKEVSSTGAITISRTLTVGGTSIVLTGGSGSALSVAIPANSAVTAQGSGFQANSYVDIYVYSKSIYLGSFKVDSRGNVVDEVRIPANLAAGNHTLVIAGKKADGKKFVVPAPIVVGKAVVISGKKLNATVFFSSKVAILDVSQRNKLKALLKKIPNGAKNLQVRVQGFSERQGSTSQSAKILATARANSVAKYFAANKIGKSSLNVNGLGWYGFNGKLGNRVEVELTWK
jgi:outer membrane protein OmpA-like peptidoglycan-associated protein